MAQHLSIRVPWHDNGWNGTVCSAPCDNSACLRLKNIYENRDEEAEQLIAGQTMAGHEACLHCISEGAAFMSPIPLHRKTEHPYKHSNPKTHGHFLETEFEYPAYSAPSRPFSWMMRDNIDRRREQFGIDYNKAREPQLGFETTWVQDARNHRAIFNYFYGDIIPDESLCVLYAKQVPFVEDYKRVIIGMGHIKEVMPAVEHNHTNAGVLRSMIWEVPIRHSIRDDCKDGFVIPYREMMEYAQEHPEFDMASITVFSPEDAFNEFSFASEHVSHDAMIDVIQSCIKSFEIINRCLDKDYSGVLEWLNTQLDKVWEDRGAFPGLGPMLSAFKVPLGVLVAKTIREKTAETENIWDVVDRMFTEPGSVLPDNLVKGISTPLRSAWKCLSEDRKSLFRLLSRFSLSIEQAEILFNDNERRKCGIECTDRDIIENPYILYEKSRLKKEEHYISVRKVDRAVFPVASVLEKYPLEAPSALESDNDQRRIRAIAVSVLEDAANAGHTFLPCNFMVDRMRETVLEPVCPVTQDILNALTQFLKPEIIRREMKDGTEYYKLARLQEFDSVIEERIRKRMGAEKLAIAADWRKMLEDKFGPADSELEKRARQEKAAILSELAQSRIAALVGDAGTGKTTVLSVLCDHPDIKAGGVLLLAPTGKATVRLQESMGRNAECFTAKNIAQFLSNPVINGFDWDAMRYQLPAGQAKGAYGTAIIDEASMLTEEMFGAVLGALKNVKRIIFVGDPNQLPPIGAGRPFVDLVYLLRQKLKPGFPKVCDCYGELTVNRRQQANTIRADVQLSKVFTSSEEPVDEDAIAAISKGEDGNIRFVQWESKDDLEEKLLGIMADVAGMSGVDDQAGFDLSLGGTKTEYGIFFNKGSSAHAEDWQILAPVRNMPQGVSNINHLIHQKYREHFLEVSQRYGKAKRIAKMLGPENIVYGDKVINVTNSRKDAWPKENARNYIANGEIGIACGDYKSGKTDNYMHVEFSSQKGYQYSFDSHDFGEEGTPNLELAYALTVHKSQGSQFKAVILVIADPCRILSREMLYTALTRQTDRIIILYNRELFRLLDYSADANSDIAKRFTDLFADVFPDDDIDLRPQIVEAAGAFFEERLVHKTVRGELVRSKSEVIIANCLHYNGLDYEYEPELVLEGRVKRPDFKIEDGDTGEVWYWEHCGMMSDPQYKKRWEDKKKFYEKNGIIEGKNLIVTYDENGTLDSGEIDKIIRATFDL